VNAGYQNSLEQKIQSALESAAEKAVTAGLTALGSAAGGGLGGALGSAVGQAGGPWLVGEVLGLILPDCDGPVAGATHTYSGAQVAHQTANGVLMSATDDNPGTDSAWTCGSNSHYKVTWSISGKPGPMVAHPVARERVAAH
jgi:hypothetical protein